MQDVVSNSLRDQAQKSFIIVSKIDITYQSFKAATPSVSGLIVGMMLTQRHDRQMLHVGTYINVIYDDIRTCSHTSMHHHAQCSDQSRVYTHIYPADMISWNFAEPCCKMGTCQWRPSFQTASAKNKDRFIPALLVISRSWSIGKLFMHP